MTRVNKLKKHLVILVTIIMIAGMISPTAALYANASDIKGHWAESTIKTWSDEGLINAYPNGTFKPDRYVSRAEFISMTNRAFHFTQEASHSFGDVADDEWYAGEISKAIQAGYIKGYSDGTIRPDSSVTRQEAAAILIRLLDLSPNESRTELLTDAESIPSWSRGSIGSIISSGIMKGYPDGRFGPAAGMTRAEAVVTLERARNHETAFKTAGTYGPTEGTKTVCGHVFVKADGTVLQNLIITGNLTITEEVGKGDVTLNNITVYGETYIRGGGKDSIHINGGVFRNVVVQNVDGQVRIVATSVNGLTVIIAEDAAGEEIILEGSFASVVLEEVSVSIVTQGRTSIGEITVRGNSGNPVLTLSERTTVGSMVLESSAEVKGTGTVMRAEIKADGVSFEKAPAEQTVAPGVNPPSTTPPSTTPGGSSSDDSSPPPPATPDTYTLTVLANPSGGGSAADSTATGPYVGGAAVEVTATANAGYEFISWSNGEVIVSTDAVFAYTLPAANTTLIANFLPEGYVPVANAGELNRIRYDAENTYGAGTVFEGTYTGGLDKKYIQVADIDLDIAPYNAGAGWTPIGTPWTIAFTGIYDGNGYVIDNLFINRPSTDGIGLFGYVGEPGQLNNISLTNANVTGDEEVGILAGASEGHIDNCSSAGQVTGNVDTGGLVGISYNFDKTIDRHTLIKNSHSAAAVQNSNLYGGGLVGSNYGKIENCFSTGAVTGAAFGGGGYAGGLAGQNFGMVTGSYSTGNVNGDGAGGLVGENYKNVMASKYEAQILNSYATGTVSGESTLGGLVGYSSEGSITNCYATGNVSGKDSVAGLVGELGSGTLSNSFALNSQITRTSGSDTHFGRIIGWEGGTLDDNYARDDMIFTWIAHLPVSNADGKDGAGISDWTITDGIVSDYTLTPVLSDIATISSETFQVGAASGGAANILGIPYGTAKTTILSALTKGNAAQTWDSDNIADPVVSGNTLVVTAENGITQITYTIYVNTTLGDPTPIAAGTPNPNTTISLLNSTFTAGAENTGNWTITTGTTGLTVTAITLQGDAGDATGVTIDFTGDAAAGNISLKALAAAVTSGRDTTAVQLRVPSNDTAVSSQETYYTVSVHGTSLIPADNPITRNSLIISTADLVGEFTDRLNFPDESAFKVLSNATVTAAGGFETWDFDSMEDKLNTARLALDDILLVKAEDGTLRGYHITVIPQVFFSEYVEGDSTYKALEIYNYTGSSIDLQAFGFKIETYSNGAAVATDTVVLTGTINSGDVYVVATALVVSTLTSGTVDQEYALMYNGNDAVVLKMGEQILDRIGQVGVDPGIAWTGGDIDTVVSTQNQTLRRKEHITSGDRNAAESFDPSDQWLPFEINTLDGLGAHSIDTEPK